MKTIVVYTSMTGTTERMAQVITDELTKAGDQVTMKDVFEADAWELTSYERILLGCYTWGDGELADEILDFHDQLENIDLTGKYAAAFGPGSSSYDQFARAVDILDETLSRKGCEIITKGLKVDTWSDDEEKIKADCVNFAQKIVHLTPQRV
ncbi:flavodoxin [Bacillus tuaregi]|uniref:flavodoxin n=1 Tax=Bacillus tuaregi TaxID=1816695 RepID=UPI0008F824F7|nr:flavodoxin [Bacillus tuaregi]